MAEATLFETKLKELRQFKDTLTTNLTRWKRKRRGPDRGRILRSN